MLHTIWLWLLVPFSLYCFSIYLKPVDGPRDRRALAMGTLGLADAAMYLPATYALVFAHLPYPFIVFRVVRGILGGMLPTIFISMGYRQGARAMLIFAGVLFVGFPLLLVFNLYRFSHGNTLHSILTSSYFYGLESWPIGVAIPAIVLILRPVGSNRQGAFAQSEQAAERGTEA
jgi:hypothetical protein